MAHLRIISVGRIKRPFWRQAAEHYLTALSRLVRVETVEVRDAPGALPPGERPAFEGALILERLGPGHLPVCLDQGGRAATSPELARLLSGWLDDPGLLPCFIVGGAFGLSPALLDPPGGRACLLSLGPMTLPHELARVVLLEQLYRAMGIIRGLPYHHA